MAARQNSVKKQCRELIIKAEDSVACPCCFEKSENVVQCGTGHHICHSCMTKVGGKCPTCKDTFTGTKCFVAQDLSKTITDLKELFDSTSDDDVSLDQFIVVETKFESYRREIKKFLYDHSRLFQNFGASLTVFNNYLENPNGPMKTQLQKEFATITERFKKIETTMNFLEKGLSDLKLPKL